MTAKITPRIYQNNRIPLCNVLPLETPIQLFIDPSSACNFSCKFCYHATNEEFVSNDVMSMNTFEKLINDMEEFPHPFTVVKLYGFGEPLINKNIARMVGMLKYSGVAARVELTTNGWLLTHETSDNLMSAGLDRIIISVNGLDDKQYREITGSPVKFEKYVEKIKYLYEHRDNCIVHVKTHINTVEGKESAFFEAFKRVSNEMFIENVVPLWPDVKSDVKTERGCYCQPVVPVKICPYIFYGMTVQANGQVSACFMDWDRKLIVGDIHKESLRDIWNGSKLNALRVSHLKYNGDAHQSCRTCGQIIYGQADNIEPCRERLLKEMM